MEIVSLTAIQELGIKENQVMPFVQHLPALKDDKESQANLAGMLAQCFDGLKLYGKTADQLTNTVKLFRMVLADFPMEQITEAFVIHLQRSSEMPTPAEIVSLIQRKGKPPLDKSIYIALVKKRERTTERYSYGTYDDLTKEEREYIYDYEKLNINGETS